MFFFCVFLGIFLSDFFIKALKNCFNPRPTINFVTPYRRFYDSRLTAMAPQWPSNHLQDTDDMPRCDDYEEILQAMNTNYESD